VAKALKIAAIVVGVAAVVLTAGTALFGAAAVAGFLGVSIGTLATITAVLGVTAAALNVAAGLAAPKPSFGSLGGAGTQLDFMADPTSGEPYAMGNVRVGEAVVHEASWGAKNKFLGIVGVLSCAGPIMAYDGFYADNTAVAFSGGNATGYYANFLYEQTQLGARPESAALAMTAPDATAMPDWGSDHKLSGLAAAGLILVADIDNGKIYSGGVPQMTHQIRGVLAYDPRLDSTNGGSGSQRPGGLGAAETAYAYSDNPWVHHGTFALGRWVNGVRVIGPGLPSASIDWASHIEAANIAQANGWTISGRILSTDNKWDVLRSIAQAGGGYPVPTQSKLACLVNTPRVSLETIEEAHVKGAVSVPQMSMRRDRLNGGMARYREPSLGWQVLDGNIVRNSTYLAADGGTTKTKEIDLPLVANKDQAAQLVAYEVANSRERSPIQVPLDLYWAQYKMGDCITLNLPSALLFNQKCVVIGRELDPDSNTVTLTFRTEDDAKHTWALGVSGGTVPTTTVGSSAGSGDTGGSLTGEQLTAILRSSFPHALRFTSTDAGTSADLALDGGSSGTAFVIELGTTPPIDVNVSAVTLHGLPYGTTVFPYADVVNAALDPASWTFTIGWTSTYASSLNQTAYPLRIPLGNVTTAASGGAATSGGGSGGGYGPPVGTGGSGTQFP
jgi:trimeric autotransporter adhesin